MLYHRRPPEINTPQLVKTMRIIPTRLGSAVLLALVGVSAAPTQALAEPHADSIRGDAAQLAPITVSANPLLDNTILDMTAPATVLDEDDLMTRRQATLGDTLNGQPGIHADTFGAGASRPVVRGQTAPRVSVVSDGSALMDASGVSPDHAITSEPMLSERIEVLRGPATLLYGGGAIGGVVNVLDRKVPDTVPDNGIEGAAEIRGATGSEERAGVVGITAGAGNLAVRVEAVKRDSNNYRIPDSADNRLDGSYNNTATGALGLSWITARGYTGLAYTHQESRYGLPGHSHEYASCHTHGDVLHCGHHHHGHGHDHSHHHHDGAPWVDLRSDRLDLRSEVTEPFAGVERLRFRSGVTDYRHDEIEGSELATRFRNRGYDARLELAHKPLQGWRGVFGTQAANSVFSANGEEGFLPKSRTRSAGLFVLEEYRLNDWRFETGARQDWQRIRPDSDVGASRDTATSLSAAANWQFATQYSTALSLSRSQRMPSAQELYAEGNHLATNTYERGNPNLKKETSYNIDLTLRKTAGDTTFSAGSFYNHVNGYVYAHTLDRHEDFRLIEYTQRDAEFVGVEGEVAQRFSPLFRATLFGDYVRGKLVSRGGGNLPRIPAARLGVRGDVTWHAWSGELEYYHVFRQRDTATYETSTAGYHMVNATIAYDLRMGEVQAEIYLRGSNLLNQTARNHASFLVSAAPLPGRSVMAGIRASWA